VLRQREIPEFLERMIDEAVSADFTIEPLKETDFQNETYKLMKYSLEFYSAVDVLYERKVVSNLAPVIPKVQYLFGFRPVEGLCILTKNRKHKEVLCDGELFEIIRTSTSLIHSLMYLLVEQSQFNVWSYLPLDKENSNINDDKESLELRRKLFTNA
jgi:hypothetical protein